MSLLAAIFECLLLNQQAIYVAFIVVYEILLAGLLFIQDMFNFSMLC